MRESIFDSAALMVAISAVLAMSGGGCDRQPASEESAVGEVLAEPSGGAGQQEEAAQPEAPSAPSPAESTGAAPQTGAGDEHAEGRARAEALATKTLTAWRGGTFEPLTDDFTGQMRAALAPATQQTAYQQAQAMFGDFQGLTHHESVTVPQAPGMVVHRFKGLFSKAGPGPEVRVVLDPQSKVAGFWLKVWNPVMQ